MTSACRALAVMVACAAACGCDRSDDKPAGGPGAAVQGTSGTMADPATGEGAMPGSAASAAGAADGSPSLMRSAFGEFTFELPPGWAPAEPETKSKDAVAVWAALNGKTLKDAEAVLTVSVFTPPKFPTPDAFATTFARKAGGTVLPEAATVDGERGVRVRTDSDDMSRPHQGMLMHRGGKEYLVIAMAAPGHDASEAFDHMLRTWRWADGGGDAPPGVQLNGSK